MSQNPAEVTSRPAMPLRLNTSPKTIQAMIIVVGGTKYYSAETRVASRVRIRRNIRA